MIPKANQRAGGQQLATHLLNAFDNDRVDVAQVRGAIAPDLHGAFAEWRAVASATQCRKYLYSLSVNPDPRQRPITRKEYYDYIARVEKALGLINQPRAVVFHVKYGREHCHVVWSRIDPGRMRAVQLSHDRQTLRTVTREFAREHGIELPPGMREDKGKDRYKNRQKLENLGEKQQEERTGISKAERMDAITAAWRESKSAETFSKALEDRGYFLARGDKRAYVVVDLYGEIHSLARQVRGAKARDIKARLARYKIDKLPDATRAQAFARQQLEARRVAAPDPIKGAAAKLREDLTRAQAERRRALDTRRQALLAQHRAEREALAAAQESLVKGILSARVRAQPKGVIAFLARITGIKLLVAQHQKRQDRARAAEQKGQRQALARRHQRELEEFRHHDRALTSLDKRERRSLETTLRREQFRAIARPPELKPQPEVRPGPEPRRPAPQDLTPQQRESLEKILANSRDITAPATPRAPRSDASVIATTFNELAQRLKEESKQAQRGQSGKAPNRLDEIRTTGAEITSPDDELAAALKGRARQKQRQRERDRDRRRGPDRGR